jgi:hypothetical protein
MDDAFNLKKQSHQVEIALKGYLDREKNISTGSSAHSTYHSKTNQNIFKST